MRRDNGPQQPKAPQEFEEKILQLKRVSKKTKGGNTISFAALIVLGDKKGRVGYGYGKGRDVQSAISKGVSSAKRSLITVPMVEGTIAHEVIESFGSAEVMLKPAPKGAGIIAGGPVRIIATLAGIKDVSAKMLGSSNKMCNIRCTLMALQKLKATPAVAAK